MRFSFAPLLLLLPSIGAVTLSYDTVYDNGSLSLGNTACSDGENGLQSKGFTDLKSLPKYPYVGGTQAVAGWNSANCGSCWKLTYKGKSINVLAIDHTGAGFNIALAAMNALTNGQATQLGRIDVTSTEVAASVCGL